MVSCPKLFLHSPYPNFWRLTLRGCPPHPRSGDPNNPAHVKHEMPAAEPADPVRAKAEAVERLGDESPAMTNPTKSLDDTLAVRAHKGCHQAEHKGRRDS